MPWKWRAARTKSLCARFAERVRSRRSMVSGFFTLGSPCPPLPLMSCYSESARNATWLTSVKVRSRAWARANERVFRHVSPGPVFYGDHVHHGASLELFIQFDK